ncbi:MAG: tyrosine-type recombinase/integrase [Actinobacteria bacterium]|nr:tyrosine-type recombinase/integrase [Actinomycetota bacterium]
MFTTCKGTPIDPDNSARYFHCLRARADLGHWTPHELRHSAASIMLAQGAPLWVVPERCSDTPRSRTSVGISLAVRSRRRPKRSRMCFSTTRTSEDRHTRDQGA